MTLFFLQFPISINLFISIVYEGHEILIASSFVEKTRISLKRHAKPLSNNHGFLVGPHKGILCGSLSFQSMWYVDARGFLWRLSNHLAPHFGLNNGLHFFTCYVQMIKGSAMAYTHTFG
jgi:hypothetical protein